VSCEATTLLESTACQFCSLLQPSPAFDYNAGYVLTLGECECVWQRRPAGSCILDPGSWIPASFASDNTLSVLVYPAR